MSARITPLRLEAFEQLPKHARRCVFWELDPATLGARPLTDPEFEKEAWLSLVMLEWGSCGQLATAAPPAPGEPGQPAALGSPIGPRCLGYVFYAPPRVVPRAQRFPTGPVSADAVLLTSLGIEPGHESAELAQRLLGQVVQDLVRRGVRALEAFGRMPAATELTEFPAADASTRAVLEAAGDCWLQHCIIDAEFLQEAGFTVVAPHRYFPRLRLELTKGLGWKADVEAALERLLETTELPQPAVAGAVVKSR